MPCPHKFEKYLTLQRLDFEPTTLVVGTFNPTWPASNYAPWFYGRTQRNYFWDVLPRLCNPGLNLRGATPAEWKAFCSDYQLALTDIITCINDADEHKEAHRNSLSKYVDTAIANTFCDFTFTNIIGLLQQHPTIQNVYLTRQPGIQLFDAQWAAVEAYGQSNGLHVRNLLTPSFNARYQMGPYKKANPNGPEPLRNFIHWSWMQQWHT